ncbi:MAG: amidohydrolase family protein [Gammaproteobacteria bacterium]|nr:amidohydrolase family protein [Gammaproteobacteria bacterium]
MRHCLLLLMLCPYLFGCSERPGDGSQLLIEHVSVVAMDAPRVLPDHSVLIEAGVITHVGPSGSFEVPQQVPRIDGRGRFLMPGLAEMHAHLPGEDDEQHWRDAILSLFVSQGVTFARSMLGADDHPALRDAIAAGQRFGPTLLVAGPFLSGTLDSVEEARTLAQSLHDQDFDLLKIGEGLSPEVYATLTAEADRLQMPFAGHVPDDVGLLDALAAGQATVDHLDNYVEALRGPDAPAGYAPIFGAAQLAPYADRSLIPQLASATRDARTAVVPTMLLWSRFFGDETPSELEAATPEMRYVPPAVVDSWQSSLRRIRAGFDPEAGTELIALRIETLAALHQAGAYILLGSDAPQIFNVPGFSLHQEMRYLQDEVGLPPFEVLFSATRAVAEHVGQPEAFGTVLPGRRADLILLRDNPLEDVGHVASIDGVVLRGHWIPREDLDARLQAIENRFRRR